MGWGSLALAGTTDENGKKNYYNLPDYSAFGPNSNGYVASLVEMAGGSVELPFRAVAKGDTNEYKMRVFANAISEMAKALDEITNKMENNKPASKQ